MPSSRGSSDPGIEPAFLMSPALAGEFFTTSATSDNTIASSQQYGWSCLSLWSERMPGYLSDGDLSRGRTAGLASHSRTKGSTALPMKGMAVL